MTDQVNITAFPSGVITQTVYALVYTDKLNPARIVGIYSQEGVAKSAAEKDWHRRGNQEPLRWYVSVGGNTNASPEFKEDSLSAEWLSYIFYSIKSFEVGE
jgi:hypothetical protein